LGIQIAKSRKALLLRPLFGAILGFMRLACVSVNVEVAKAHPYNRNAFLPMWSEAWAQKF